MRTDLEELKRMLAEEGPRLKADLAQMRHTGLTLVNALPDLIARVERAEKERDHLRKERDEDQRVFATLTGDTPNV